MDKDNYVAEKVYGPMERYDVSQPLIFVLPRASSINFVLHFETIIFLIPEES